MRRIKGKLEDLLDPQVVEAADCEDYISAVLTDEEELADPMEKLRASYPNIMELNLEKRQSPAVMRCTPTSVKRHRWNWGNRFLS